MQTCVGTVALAKTIAVRFVPKIDMPTVCRGLGTMPPKRNLAKNQTTLTSLLRKEVKVEDAVTTNTVVMNPEDTDIAEFYASLSPQERIAHEIAKTALGMSYRVRETRGFKARKLVK